MSAHVLALAEEIKEKGRRSTLDLPPLLEKAEQLALSQSEQPLTRALAHRAAANALQLMNKFEPSLLHYNAAVSLFDDLNERSELGRTLHAKVGLLFFMSRFEEVLECAGRARVLFEELGDRQRLARLDVNLSHAYQRLDRYDEVLRCAERALPILEDIGDREGLFVAFTNSGVALSAMHDFAGAEHRYLRALEIASELNITSWILQSRHNLALLRYLAGDTANALREIVELRRTYESANDERFLCGTWLDEAEILLEVGDLEDVVHAAQQAGILARKLGLNFEIGKAHLFEAMARRRLGDNEVSRSLLEKAIVRFGAEQNGVWVAVSKLQAALMRGEDGNADALREAASARLLLRNSGLAHRLALADIVIGRIQRSFGDDDCAIDSFKSAVASADSSNSKWMQYHACYELGVSLARKQMRESTGLFERAENILDSLWNCLGSDDLKMAFLSDRENVYSHLVRSVSTESAARAFEYSEKSRSRVLRETLIRGEQKPLAAGESLVEYFIAGDDLYIFVATRDGLECVRRRGVVGRLNETWSNLERHFASCSVKWERLENVRAALENTARTHLHVLHDELIAPIESTLRHRVIFVPYGFLHGIPFHALQNGEQYLIDKYEIAYSPNAAIYRTAVIEETSSDPLFIAFGADKTASSVLEIEDAAAHFPVARALVNPSRVELQSALSTPRSLIHIAGHAGIDAVGGKLSWIETSEGKLTSREIADMNVRTKTLVITGCQSARRLIQPGDEWLGLMRAFYMAGASTIVSAFWNIRDESARIFASQFYKTFNGANAAAAVQTASRELRRWRNHPYFWAGFGVFLRKTT